MAKGEKMGMSLYTESKEKEEMEAMLPVPKKAIWIRKKKKRDVRVSERFKGRKAWILSWDIAAAIPCVPSFSEVTGSTNCEVVNLKIKFSILTQVTKVRQNAT